jgi:anti-anti-sigma regulatory factor
MTTEKTASGNSKAARILEMLTRIAAGDLETRLEPSDEADDLDLIMSGLNMLSEEFAATLGAERLLREDLQEKLNLIEAQGRTILELSTPALEIWDEVLVLPLVGTVDTLRAQQIIEVLLETIVKTQAAVAILDVTGVPVIDTAVANHLIKTIEAARMLGADVIVTGVNPENAQTLVKLGVDLAKVTAKSSLKVGLKLALAKTNKRA